MKRWIFTVLLCVFYIPVVAQDEEREETLADIRQDLSYLFVEIQKLNRELSTTFPTGLSSEDSIVLRRRNTGSA